MGRHKLENKILIGPDPVFEPEKGGLGYELFRALTMNTGSTSKFQQILETGETLSYNDLFIRSVRTAICLAEKTLKKDDIVCLCSGNNLHTVVTLVASKFANVQYASMEPTLPIDDMIYLLNLLKPKLLFVAEDALRKIEEAFAKSKFQCEVVSLGTSSPKYKTIHQLYTPKDGEENYSPISVENLKETAIIFLSSGTTGKPKGVCINHYTLLAQTYMLWNYFHHKGTINFSNFTEDFSNEKNSILHYSPLYWISGFLLTMVPIFCGGSVIIGTAFEAVTAWHALDKYQPGSVILPPGQVNVLCAYGASKKPIRGVSTFGTGGGVVTARHMKDIKNCFPNTKVSQLYGQTENTGTLTLFNTNDQEEMEYQEKHLNSCGRPVDGYRMKVVDMDSEKICGPGERGELRLKNEYTIMNGYYKMDSSSVFDSDGWFKTGDLVYYDEKGYIYVVDRIKDLLLYTLYNITPSVIEEILRQHPAVLECCVIGKKHLRDNEHPMGIVVLRPTLKEGITEENIISFVNERVPDDRYKIRAGIKFVNELLKTTTGKPRKLEMKRFISEGVHF